MENEEAVKSDIVAKAGLWYTICNFIFKGMAFFTVPIFARKMSKAELGSFSNFSSWAGILLVITSLDLSQSIIRSKLEFKNDMDNYMWSILILSTVWTGIICGIIFLFMPFFSGLFAIKEDYMYILFLYLLTAPAYLMFITKQRAFYRYKSFVMLTGIMAVTGTLVSLILITVMENKLEGRIIGHYIPQIIIGATLFIIIGCKGKRLIVSYWKYAIYIMLPLVPHVLSLHMLSSSDKIIITRLCGEEYTAIYSIAYSAYHIVTILFDSMNKAWAPWLLDSLNQERYEDILSVSRKYIGVFMLLVIGIFIMAPEIVLFLGGKQYAEAVYCLPPLIASCVFQFIYTMFVNIEFYKKKTIGVSVATLIATGINIVLNFIFIPKGSVKGHIIAAYTTLVGYIVLFILHYLIVKRMEMNFIYDVRFIMIILAITLLVSLMVNILYESTVFRYVTMLGYGIFVIYQGYINKDKIFEVLGKTR